MNTHKWGWPQQVETIVEGVVSVSAAGHGGIVLSRERNRLVPEPAREADGCYEEDLDWAKAWAALRRAGVIGDEARFSGRPATAFDGFARDAIRRSLPDLSQVLLGEDPDPDSPVLAERRDCAEARAKGLFLAVAAVGASISNAVPEGMVGAVLAPAHPVLDGPDVERTFFALVESRVYAECRRASGHRILDETQVARLSFDPFHAARPDVPSPSEAYGIASQWGSLLRGGDPGAVFYSFPFEDARPRSPEHRLALIRWTRECRALAEERAAEPEGRADIEALDRLEVFFATAEQAPEPEDAPAP